MALFLDYAERRNFDIALFAVAGAAVVGGLIITRLVETYGKQIPLVPTLDEEWSAAASTGTSWQPDRPDTWVREGAPAAAQRALGRRALGRRALRRDPVRLCWLS